MENTIGQVKRDIMTNIKLQLNHVESGRTTPPIYISGAPGIGKSDIIKQIAIDMNAGLVIKYIGTMMVEQFGLPMPLTEADMQAEYVFQKWSYPEIFNDSVMTHNPDDKKFNILFIDDMHLANKTIQSYLFELLLLRSIHGKRMPDNWVMVAAGNRKIDKANFQPIMAPIANRLNFKDVVAKADDWIENYAYKAGIRPDIISFLDHKPNHLQTEPMESQAWTSPRSWSNASYELDMYEKMFGVTHDVDDLRRILDGLLGETTAAEFIEYKVLFQKWDTEKILDGKIAIDYKDLKRMEVYSLLIATTHEYLKRLRKSEWDATDKSISKDLKSLGDVYQNVVDKCDNCNALIPLALKNIFYTLTAENQSELQYEILSQLTKSHNSITKLAMEIISTD